MPQRVKDAKIDFYNPATGAQGKPRFIGPPEEPEPDDEPTRHTPGD